MSSGIKKRKSLVLAPRPPSPDPCSSSSEEDEEIEGYEFEEDDSESEPEEANSDVEHTMESEQSGDINESSAQPEESESDSGQVDDDDDDGDTGPDPTDNSSLLDAEEEDQRTTIRRELSNYTFEELEKLKSKLGTKVYNEAMFGKQSNSNRVSRINKKKKPIFKRENKNRPRELSSKIRVPRVREVVHVTRKKRRDPRFEDLCGELDEKLWNKDYEFLRDIAKEEHGTLREKMKSTEMDEDEKERIKLYLQRMKNKERSNAEKAKAEAKLKLEKSENVKRMKEGKRPYFMKKTTRKFVELAEKYDQLKESGKLESYLKKKRIKNAARDKKSVKLQRIE